MQLSDVQLDRVAGVVVGCAAGDALGAPYEFQPTLPADVPARFGRGTFGHDPGEWTDDTSMSVPILQALAAGRTIDDPATTAGLVAAWLDWSRTAKDVGIQTRAVLGRLDEPVTEAGATDAAAAVHRETGRSAGNGALMRTGPLALGFLADGRETALVAAAGRVARLTHAEDDNADACAIWCLAIRHAVRSGEPAVGEQVRWLPSDRQQRWAELVDRALAPSAQPGDFAAANGWVVAALQGALCAVAGASSLVDALQRAVHGGNDTDTIAAIAGALAGARWGAGQVPDDWRRVLHGWPGLRADDLAALAVAAATR